MHIFVSIVNRFVNYRRRISIVEEWASMWTLFLLCSMRRIGEAYKNFTDEQEKARNNTLEKPSVIFMPESDAMSRFSERQRLIIKGLFD